MADTVDSKIIQEQQHENNLPENEVIKKDSKRSWLVCLGAFFFVGTAMSMTNCVGVLFVSWTQEFHAESRTKIAWIASFQVMWYMSLCPVSGILTRYYSFRPVVLLGSVLFCLGLLLSSFVNDIPVFYLTYGVLFGTGTSLLFMPGIIVLQFCFEKHLGTATGIVTGANSGFTMWYGPVYEYLIRRYGWRATLRIVTFFLIPLAVSCALFPSKKQLPSDRDRGSLKVKKSLRRLLKNKVFLIWFLLMTLVYLGIGVPMVHLISFCKDIGIPTYVSVYNITLMCGMETVAKIVSGKLMDILNWNSHTYNILSLLTLAVSMALLPLAKTVTHVLTFSVFYGFGMGIQSLCFIIITPELTHPDDSKYAVTYLFGALSIAGGVGPGVAAWIFDLTQSYHLAFFITGGCFACAACLGILIKFLALKDTNMSYEHVLTTNEHVQLREFTIDNSTDMPIKTCVTENIQFLTVV